LINNVDKIAKAKLYEASNKSETEVVKKRRWFNKK
jgi:hypothetical protein